MTNLENQTWDVYKNEKGQTEDTAHTVINKKMSAWVCSYTLMFKLNL